MSLPPVGGYERAYVTDKITDQVKYIVFLNEPNMRNVQHAMIQLVAVAGEKFTTKPTNFEKIKHHTVTAFEYMSEKDTLPTAVINASSIQQIITTPS